MPWLTVVLALVPSQQPATWLDLFQRSERFVAESEFHEAERCFREALELDPANPTVAVHLAKVCARSQRSEEAFVWLARSVEWGFDDAAVLAWDADLAPLHADGRWPELLARATPTDLDPPLARRLPLGEARVSADGRRALTTGDGRAVLWDVEDGSVVASFEEEEITEALFDVAGALALTRTATGAWLARDAASGVRRPELDGPPAVRPDERAALLVDADRQVPVRTLRPPGEGIGDLRLTELADPSALRAWVPAGRRSGVVLDADCGLLIVPRFDRVVLVEARSGRTRCVLASRWIAYSPAPLGAGVVGIALDGEAALVITEDGSLRVVDLATGASRRTIEARAERVELARDGRHAATTDGAGAIVVWDLATGAERWRLDGVGRGVGFAPHPEGRSLALWRSFGTREGVVVGEDGRELLAIPAQPPVRSLCWSPDGRSLASAHTDATVRVWNLRNGRCVVLQPGFEVEVVSFDPVGGRLAVGGRSEEACVWDLAEPVAPLRLALPPDCLGGPGRCGDLVWSRAGELVATTGCADVRLFRGEQLAAGWTYSFGSGVESPLTGVPTEAGHVVFHGMTEQQSHVLSVADGRLLADLSARAWNLVGETAGGVLVASDDSLVLFDAGAFVERLRRLERPGGHWVAHTPGGWCAGTAEGLRDAWTISAGQPVRIADLAPRLYDPTRVRASAAGVAVRPPSELRAGVRDVGSGR